MLFPATLSLLKLNIAMEEPVDPCRVAHLVPGHDTLFAYFQRVYIHHLLDWHAPAMVAG